MNIPNFFIIGAPKCGTTALSEYLREHQNVFMCSPKEPKYFDFDLNYPIAWTRDAYLGLYAKANPNIHIAIGEASVTYLFSERAVEEILKLSPSAKFIVMLRNPVDLVRSWHAQQVFTGQENIPDFEKAWTAQEYRRKREQVPFACYEPKMLLYSSIGKLGDQLERLFSKVSKENVKIIIFDEFIGDTKKSYEDVLEFLNIPSDGRSRFQKVNEGKQVKWLWLQQMTSLLISATLIVKTKLRIINQQYGVLQKLLIFNSSYSKRSEVSDAFYEELIDFFKADIKKLSILLKRDLSFWSLKK